jgi:hypothetical protein
VINELRAVYAKRNIDPQARLQRMHPVVTGANELGGYGSIGDGISRNRLHRCCPN